MTAVRPRRSMLYMPASNPRALAKARQLDADALILDLEDAVAPDAKDGARELLRKELKAGGFGSREVLVRVNSLDSPWGRQDMAAVAGLPVDGVVLPKVESAETLIRAEAALDAAGAPLGRPLWAMIETPLGVLEAQKIATSTRRLAGVVMGTSDLSKEARILNTADRLGLIHALSHCLLVARAYGLLAIDGVHLDLDNEAEFITHCEQGRALGFDGKSLIHPRQIAVANRVFAPSAAEIDRSRAILAAWASAEAQGQGVCVVDGRLVENLHVDEARRLLALDEAIRALADGP